jgi:NitT/TauT family transport system substrate-binding protein
VAIPRQPPCALVFVAQEHGLFAREGLDIVPVYHSSGKEALAALTRGEADFASAAETPAAIESFTNDSFRVLAAIASTDNDPCIVARRDAGIAGPADLRGKRVGTQRASAVHFFLHLFLTRHLIPDDQVACEFGTGERVVARIISGDVDAVCVREPQVTHATAALGANAIVFREPGLYRRWEVLAGSVKVLRERPATAMAMLRALRAAQKLTESRRSVAGEALAKALAIDIDTALASVRETDLRVRLSQDLLVSLEEEARWAAQKKMAGGTNVPDFLRILYPDPLVAVDPDSVTMTHRPRGSP